MDKSLMAKERESQLKEVRPDKVGRHVIPDLHLRYLEGERKKE